MTGIKKDELKLFIWTGFSPDYTDGLAFAIAETEEEAMELVIEDRGYEVFTWGDLEIREISKCARSVYGGS